jgi:hypothetical protein
MLAALGAMVLSITFAAAIEIVQDFTESRSAQGRDMLVGTGGALLGGFAALLLSRTKFSRIWQWRCAAAFVVFSMLSTGLAMVAWDPSYPRVSDHWHAAYAIDVCGERMPLLPAAQGDIHTHGDGFIHVHPFTRETSGRNATLALAFATSGAELGDDYLVLPGGDTFTNGDRCPDGDVGQLTVTVNGEPVDTPTQLVPRDRDVIRVAFD